MSCGLVFPHWLFVIPSNLQLNQLMTSGPLSFRQQLQQEQSQSPQALSLPLISYKHSCFTQKPFSHFNQTLNLGIQSLLGNFLQQEMVYMWVQWGLQVSTVPGWTCFMNVLAVCSTKEFWVAWRWSAPTGRCFRVKPHLTLKTFFLSIFYNSYIQKLSQVVKWSVLWFCFLF